MEVVNGCAVRGRTPDKAIEYVMGKNAAVTDGREEWRVVEVRRPDDLLGTVSGRCAACRR